MGDFLLDLRPQDRRRLTRAAARLRFAEDTRVAVVDAPAYGLAITYTGDPALWAPFEATGGSLVAVAGRPVFDESEWDAPPAVEGTGGRAASVISDRVQEHGVRALEQLNGNYAVVVHDAPRQLLHLVTDVCGVFPAFAVVTPGGLVLGSHPDVLAEAANETHRLDETSLAEFILSGTVSPPFSYYEHVRAVGHASIVTMDLAASRPGQYTTRRYYDFAYRADATPREDALAGELAAALRRSVARRTLPRLGPSAVALSGGLDSRVILSASLGRARPLAFTCFDQPNLESRTAETIARALSVRFLPCRRGPDYYAENAEQGVRISGGMGSLANNHFLGVMSTLKGEGIANVLTGCYCDYLFKALPLNRRLHWLTRREQLAPFSHEFYFGHYPASSGLADLARARLEERVPRALRRQESDQAVFELETARTFPLSYEGDNEQRLVPQRVIGWCPPFVDRDLMDVYCKIPYRFKLNRSIFRTAVAALAPGLRSIPDANTGAPPDASPAREWLGASRLRARRVGRRLSGRAFSDESFPNWHQYAQRSLLLDGLWRRPNPEAMDLFRRVLGPSFAPSGVEALKRDRPFLFVSLLTVKLWLDLRR